MHDFGRLVDLFRVILTAAILGTAYMLDRHEMARPIEEDPTAFIFTPLPVAITLSLLVLFVGYRPYKRKSRP